MSKDSNTEKRTPSITALRIKKRRENLGMSQDVLAQEMGYTDRTSITQIELGKNEVKLNKLIAFANALKTSTSYLLGITNDPNLTDAEVIDMEHKRTHSYPEIIASSTGSIDDIFPNNTPHKKSSITPAPTVQLPIYGNVAAGMGAYADNDIIGYEDIPQEWIRGKGDYVLLRVQGDSMYPVFMENDLLLVKCQPIVDNGAYAVVLIDDDSGVVKRVIRGNGWIELQSVNPMYVPRRFEGADMERLRIFGLVKKSIRNYE